MTAQEIAQTTLAQLGGTNRLAAMIGAYNFAFDKGGEVSFRFKGCKDWNYIKITLNADDTYTVQFAKIRGVNVKWGEARIMVPVENLRTLIENETHLYLSLGTMGRK